MLVKLYLFWRLSCQSVAILAYLLSIVNTLVTLDNRHWADPAVKVLTCLSITVCRVAWLTVAHCKQWARISQALKSKTLIISDFNLADTTIL